MLAVFDASESTLATRLVALALADYAHDDGSNAFPALETLAARARVDERTARRALRWLEQRCEIVRTGKTRSGVVKYHLTICEPLAVDVALVPGVDNMTPEVGSSLTVKGSGDNPPPDAAVVNVRSGGTDSPLDVDPGLPLSVQRWIGKNAARFDPETAREVLRGNYRLDGVALELAVAYHAMRRNAA